VDEDEDPTELICDELCGAREEAIEATEAIEEIEEIEATEAIEEIEAVEAIEATEIVEVVEVVEATDPTTLVEDELLGASEIEDAEDTEARDPTTLVSDELRRASEEEDSEVATELELTQSTVAVTALSPMIPAPSSYIFTVLLSGPHGTSSTIRAKMVMVNEPPSAGILK